MAPSYTSANRALWIIKSPTHHQGIIDGEEFALPQLSQVICADSFQL
jgi:hypothetical protein